jgi:uncharacterized membrane protein YuzA (DUF378 family)
MKFIDHLVGFLLVLAGVNCGLIAVFQYDVFTATSPATILTRLVFGLVGVAAIYRLFTFFLEPSKTAPIGRRQAY